MNGQYRADRTITFLPDTVILQINGDKGGLPVVAVNHIRPEIQMVQHFHNGPGEKAEAFSVIRAAVQLRAAEILLVIQKIPDDAPILQREQAAVLMPPRQIHIGIAVPAHFLSPCVRNLPVQRQDHRRTIPTGSHRRRETSQHIRKTSGLAEGSRLAGHI